MKNFTTQYTKAQIRNITNRDGAAIAFKRFRHEGSNYKYTADKISKRAGKPYSRDYLIFVTKGAKSASALNISPDFNNEVLNWAHTKRDEALKLLRTTSPP